MPKPFPTRFTRQSAMIKSEHQVSSLKSYSRRDSRMLPRSHRFLSQIVAAPIPPPMSSKTSWNIWPRKTSNGNCSLLSCQTQKKNTSTEIFNYFFYLLFFKHKLRLFEIDARDAIHFALLLELSFIFCSFFPSLSVKCFIRFQLNNAIDDYD